MLNKEAAARRASSDSKDRQRERVAMKTITGEPERVQRTLLGLGQGTEYQAKAKGGVKNEGNGIKNHDFCQAKTKGIGVKDYEKQTDCIQAETKGAKYEAKTEGGKNKAGTEGGKNEVGTEGGKNKAGTEGANNKNHQAKTEGTKYKAETKGAT